MSTENKLVPASENRPVQKRDNSSRLAFVNAKDGEKARYIRHACAVWKLPPLDISDVDQIEDRVYWYFERCAEDEINPSISGLANALGVHRDTLWRWRTERSRAESDRLSDLIKKATLTIEQLDSEGLRDGKTNPPAGIFLLKNHHHYQDKQDLVLTPNNPVGDAYNPEQIAAAIDADLIED